MSKATNACTNYSINSSNGEEVVSREILVKSSELDAVIQRLAVVVNQEEEKGHAKIQFFDAPDAHLLKCTHMKSLLTIASDNKKDGVRNTIDDDSDSTQSFQREEEKEEFFKNTTIFGFSWLQRSASCNELSGETDTLLHLYFDVKDEEGVEANPAISTAQQQQCIVYFVQPDTIPQSNEEIYTMLKSVLLKYPSSSSSTWSNPQKHNQIAVCLILPRQPQALEQQICNFRVGDAAPSFYLHCMAPIALHSTELASITPLSLITMVQTHIFERNSPRNFIEKHQARRPDDTILASMMVYRQLPPRLHLQPNLQLFSPVLQQNNLSSDKLDANSALVGYSCYTKGVSAGSMDSGNVVAPPSMLWEIYPCNLESTKSEQQLSVNSDEDSWNALSFRLVAPPYIDDWKCYYGDILDHFLEPNNFRKLQEEARSIPQWIPWPEQQHYSTHSKQDTSSITGSSSSNSNDSWTVFPLVHTFPATEVKNRKWILSTSSYCPRTCHMLRHNNCLNNRLRTALFSRLGPNMTLAPHTGWEDLANHVLRIHLPLIVPSCCGTWVEGCVRIHQEGIIQVFDDSKVHRAFNYNSTEERIVLIIDLARPPTLPIGTATGGHTEELDNFIEQMT
jgi:hypothetical protein